MRVPWRCHILVIIEDRFCLVNHSSFSDLQRALWRKLYARRQFEKMRARAFKKGLYLGRYQIQGLPSLCQHRHTVAELCRRHSLAQPQALALVSRKLQSIGTETRRQWQDNKELVAKLAVRVKPSAPQLAAETLRDWMAMSQRMALHQLYNAVPLSVTTPAGNGDVRRGEGAGALKSAEQLHILAHSDKIQHLSGGGSGGVKATEADKIRHVIRALDQLSAEAEDADERGSVCADGGGDEGDASVAHVAASFPRLHSAEVPERRGERLAGGDGGANADELGLAEEAGGGAPAVVEGATTSDGLEGSDTVLEHDDAEASAAGQARASTPDMLKGAWASRALRAFDEGAIRHLDSVVAVDCMADESSRVLLRSLEADNQSRAEQGGPGAGTAGGSDSRGDASGAGGKADGGSCLDEARGPVLGDAPTRAADDGFVRLGSFGTGLRQRGGEGADGRGGGGGGSGKPGIGGAGRELTQAHGDGSGGNEARQCGTQSVYRNVVIHFTLARDMVHARHVQLLRKCAGPFVIPLLDTVDQDEERGGEQQATISSRDRHQLAGDAARPRDEDVWTRLARGGEEEEDLPRIAHIYASTCEISKDSPAEAKRRGAAAKVLRQQKRLERLAQAKSAAVEMRLRGRVRVVSAGLVFMGVVVIGESTCW